MTFVIDISGSMLEPMYGRMVNDQRATRIEVAKQIAFEAQREVVNIEDALAAIQDSSGHFAPYHDDYYDDSDASEGSEAAEDDSDDAGAVEDDAGSDEEAAEDGLDDLDELDELSEIQDELDELAELEVPSSTGNKPVAGTTAPTDDESK